MLSNKSTTPGGTPFEWLKRFIYGGYKNSVFANWDGIFPMKGPVVVVVVEEVGAQQKPFGVFPRGL